MSNTQKFVQLLDNVEDTWASILGPDTAKSARRNAAIFLCGVLQAVADEYNQDGDEDQRNRWLWHVKRLEAETRNG